MGDRGKNPQQAGGMSVMELTLPNRAFQGYIFDCDGTLADTMPLHYRAFARVVSEAGGEFSEATFYQWGGRPTVRIVEDLNASLGLDLCPERASELKEAYFVEMLGEVKAIEPVVDLARRLHGQAVLAVASSGHRKYVELTLDALGIKDLFSVIVCAEDYSRGKPYPDPFLETARRMGISPNDCLVFEDSPAGLEAAANAGMECVFVPSAPSFVA